MDLGGLIDATSWADTHEHLVEEHHRLRPDDYEFSNTASGERVVLSADWSLLIDAYSVLDLIAAGLAPEVAAELHDAGRSPLEKWDSIAPFLALVRQTGFLRAVDLTTERLLGLSLSRETVEEIDVRLRALRVEGYYARVLRDVANISHCQVHSIEEHLLCESQQPELLRQDLAIAPLAFGTYAAAERESGIDVASLDDYVRVVEWCFDRYAAKAVAVKCAWAYERPLAMEVPSAPPRREFKQLRAGQATLSERRRVEDYLL